MAQPPILPGNPNSKPTPPGKSPKDLIDRINDWEDGKTIQRKTSAGWVDTWTTRITIDQDVEYRTAPVILSGWINIHAHKTSQLYPTYLDATRRRNMITEFIKTIYVVEQLTED